MAIIQSCGFARVKRIATGQDGHVIIGMTAENIMQLPAVMAGAFHERGQCFANNGLDRNGEVEGGTRRQKRVYESNIMRGGLCTTPARLNDKVKPCTTWPRA